MPYRIAASFVYVLIFLIVTGSLCAHDWSELERANQILIATFRHPEARQSQPVEISQWFQSAAVAGWPEIADGATDRMVKWNSLVMLAPNNMLTWHSLRLYVLAISFIITIVVILTVVYVRTMRAGGVAVGRIPDKLRKKLENKLNILTLLCAPPMATATGFVSWYASSPRPVLVSAIPPTAWFTINYCGVFLGLALFAFFISMLNYFVCRYFVKYLLKENNNILWICCPYCGYEWNSKNINSCVECRYPIVSSLWKTNVLLRIIVYGFIALTVCSSAWWVASSDYSMRQAVSNIRHSLQIFWDWVLFRPIP